jgi:hypothetical protein
VFILGDFLQRWQSFAFLARPTHLMGSILSGRIQSRIHPKTDNHTHRIFQLEQPKKELNHGKTTVGDDHQLPFWQPAPSLQDHLASPLRELLMLASLVLVIPFGRR